MATIIQLDPSRKKPEQKDLGEKEGCDHKHVTAYTVFRTVRCSTCGTLLDPFDVLVDMIKGYVPPDDDREEKRLAKEVKKRNYKDSEKSPSGKE